MKICCSITVRMSAAECNWENSIIPLIGQPGYIEIPMNRIEVEIIVPECPNSIFAQTNNKRKYSPYSFHMRVMEFLIIDLCVIVPVNVESIRSQIRYITIGILAIIWIDINGDTCQAISPIDNTLRNFKAMNYRFTFEIINPNGRSLYLRCIIYRKYGCVKINCLHIKMHKCNLLTWIFQQTCFNLKWNPLKKSLL